MISDTKSLTLRSTIGFSGSVQGGILVHPDGIHTIYPLGSNVVIANRTVMSDQTFLQGHTDSVTCMCISNDGKYIASGQQTHMGFQAEIIVWSVQERRMLHKFALHKVKVEALAFSPTAKYLASLGGEDDNYIVVWDIETGKAMCGAPATKDSTGPSLCLKFSNKNDHVFISGGHSHIRMWEINPEQRRIHPTECQTGQIKRIVECITVDANDEYAYCGTTTGDFVVIHMKSQLLKQTVPHKAQELFGKGILAIHVGPQAVYVGSGDGCLGVLELPKLKVTRKIQVLGTITSIVQNTPKTLLLGTSLSNIYQVNMTDWKTELLTTCHYSPVNDVCFPAQSSDVFATASDKDIRIWDNRNGAELLKIVQPNLECKTIIFSKSGSSLISGWSDGKIRAFGPQSGRLQYEIHDAHKRGVTALAVTEPNQDEVFRIVSGGADGEVRVWIITRQIQKLEHAMKEHKGAITSIFVRKNNLECVSSSADGSCIIWDLSRFVRNQVLFAPTFFKAVVYNAEECQLLTTGTDRKVGYWEGFDGSLVRELEASDSDAINGLDIAPDGVHFVIGGSDKVVKVYRYEQGDVSHTGVGHSSDINKVKFSPDGKYIISVSNDGAVFTWAF